MNIIFFTSIKFKLFVIKHGSSIIITLVLFGHLTGEYKLSLRARAGKWLSNTLKLKLQ